MYVIITWEKDDGHRMGGCHIHYAVFVAPGERPEIALEEKMDVLKGKGIEVLHVIWKST